MSTRVSARAKSTAAPRSIESRATRSDRPNPTASPSRRRPSISGPNGERTTAGSRSSTMSGRQPSHQVVDRPPPLIALARLIPQVGNLGSGEDALGGSSRSDGVIWRDIRPDEDRELLDVLAQSLDRTATRGRDDL